MLDDKPPGLSLDDEKHGNGRAFVFLPMVPNEWPFHFNRAASQQYQDRMPYCVPEFTRTRARIIITNAGQTASDLVVLEYRIILCSASEHGQRDGFDTAHAGEVMPDPKDVYLTADVVLPGKSRAVDIEWETPPWVKNLYLRARVSTLWEQTVAPEHWDPIAHPEVTEAYLEIQK